MVALQLFRMYGHDTDNEQVFFYNENYEVDFYIPEDELAIQVCYSLHDKETLDREVAALTKLPKRLACYRRIILTFDEETSFTDQHGLIEVLPCWKWMLQ